MARSEPIKHLLYRTPPSFSDIMLTSDCGVLTELHFVNQFDENHSNDDDISDFQSVINWLNIYFSGRQPNFTPKYRIDNLTPFRKMVIDILLKIPFGHTTTYGEIASQIAEQQHLAKMSAQAVGGAVGWNPIGIIVPCHRVVGAGGSLVGYSGGIANKTALLELERHKSF